MSNKSEDGECVKLFFTTTRWRKKKFQTKLAAMGLKQTNVVEAFIDAFITERTRGIKLGIQISVRRLKGE